MLGASEGREAISIEHEARRIFDQYIYIAGSSNGRTQLSESWYLGSSPSPAALRLAALALAPQPTTSFRAPQAFAIIIPMKPTSEATLKRVHAMSFAKVYPMYIAKAEKKGRTKGEVDEVIRWLTGYAQSELDAQIKREVSFETFFEEAPRLNPSRELITGTICGVRVEEIGDEIMREVRYLDKLVDELAQGRPVEKILRKVA